MISARLPSMTPRRSSARSTMRARQPRPGPDAIAAFRPRRGRSALSVRRRRSMGSTSGRPPRRTRRRRCSTPTTGGPRRSDVRGDRRGAGRSRVDGGRPGPWLPVRLPSGGTPAIRGRDAVGPGTWPVAGGSSSTGGWGERPSAGRAPTVNAGAGLQHPAAPRAAARRRGRCERRARGPAWGPARRRPPPRRSRRPTAFRHRPQDDPAPGDRGRRPVESAIRPSRAPSGRRRPTAGPIAVRQPPYACGTSISRHDLATRLHRSPQIGAAPV